MLKENEIKIGDTHSAVLVEDLKRTQIVQYAGASGDYNPLHTDAFNELIENLKEKNPTWNKTTFNYEHPVTRSLFMEENSDGDR